MKKSRTEKEYVSCSGQHCPNCDSDDIESAAIMQCDGDYAWQPIVCLKCEATWEDSYQLTGYSKLEVPEKRM